MIELNLPDMTCGHCVSTITRTVQAIDKEARVTIDLEQHKVQIESLQPADAFKSALADEGYPAA